MALERAAAKVARDAKRQAEKELKQATTRSRRSSLQKKDEEPGLPPESEEEDEPAITVTPKSVVDIIEKVKELEKGAEKAKGKVRKCCHPRHLYY